MTIWGALLLHKEHHLKSTSEYRIPPGKVYGHPHILLACITCGKTIWDEQL